MNRDTVHSYHTFLFPFKWELNGKSKRLALAERAPIKVIEQKKCINNLYWQKYQFDFKVDKGSQTYNDYFYFYEAVRDVLNIEQNKTGDTNEQNVISGLQYQYKQLNKNSTYEIQLKSGEKFELSIADVLLNFYENGVGVITFQLYSEANLTFEDILKINDYGRRVCPQFLGGNESFIDDTKGVFLADSISITNTPSELGLDIHEDFSYYNNLENLKNTPFKIPNFIQYLMGSQFTADPTNKSAKILITPILDDRMFVMNYWINDEKLLELKAENKDRQSAYKNSNDWYRFVFVDGGDNPTCQSKDMLERLLKNATYERWINNLTKEGIKNSFGQIFGLSRYSMVGIVGDVPFNRDIISSHFQNMYFELVLICLLQRTYLINFGNEVSRIAKLLDEDQSNLKRLKTDISKLYLLYIKFINRIYFREVTPQEQGIELYDLLQKQMHIKADLKELGEEIHELNSYVDTYEQGYLNMIATLFLPIGLFAGLLGINTIDTTKDSNLGWLIYPLNIFSILLFIITFLTTTYLIFKYFKIKLKR